RSGGQQRRMRLWPARRQVKGSYTKVSGRQRWRRCQTRLPERPRWSTGCVWVKNTIEDSDPP
ncbi:hypothetical protein JB92DRAFT_3067655, partial [Gautieria morchelliformis]